MGLPTGPYLDSPRRTLPVAFPATPFNIGRRPGNLKKYEVLAPFVHRIKYSDERPLIRTAGFHEVAMIVMRRGDVFA